MTSWKPPYVHIWVASTNMVPAPGDDALDAPKTSGEGQQVAAAAAVVVTWSVTWGDVWENLWWGYIYLEVGDSMGLSELFGKAWVRWLIIIFSGLMIIIKFRIAINGVSQSLDTPNGDYNRSKRLGLGMDPDHPQRSTIEIIPHWRVIVFHWGVDFSLLNSCGS